MQLFKELFPNAVILIGEILPHPNDIQSNGRISTTNYLIEEAFSSFKGDIHYVEHPSAGQTMNCMTMMEFI